MHQPQSCRLVNTFVIIRRNEYPPSLRSLDLSFNEIKEWKVLESISQFIELRELCLEGNPIGEEKLSIPFPHITSLNIASSGLSSNPILHSLFSCFPALIDIEIRRNQWYDSSDMKNARGTLIAMFPQITILNGTIVNEEERKEEELIYLNRMLNKIAEALGIPNYQTLAQMEKIREQMERVESPETVACLLVRIHWIFS